VHCPPILPSIVAGIFHISDCCSLQDKWLNLVIALTSLFRDLKGSMQ
jgi:hypothetical protein